MKDDIVEEVRKMSSIEVDTHEESIKLQKDLINFLKTRNGDEDDLNLRIGLYLYAYKLFNKKPIKFLKNQFIVYLNVIDIDLNKLKIISKQFDEFNIKISSEIENNISILLLVFELK